MAACRALLLVAGEAHNGAMQAVVYDRYGPPEVQHLEDVERPVPAPDQLLVRIHATTVTRTDCGWLRARPFFVRAFIGLFRPKRRILGMEYAGEVAEVGAAVTQFAVGDLVFGVTGFGAHAEYVCVLERGAVAHKPAGVTFEEASAVCDGACAATSCLRSVDIGPGRRLLIYGATGSIGSAAVQLARAAGADVTAVANTKNLELVRSLGADRVIDWTQEDFTRNGETYDVIFDAVGKLTFTRCRGSLPPGGTFISTDGVRNILWWAWTWRVGDKRARMGIAAYRKADVLQLKDLIDSGRYRAVIDRTYPLEEVVEATRYVETEQKTGNVVLTVGALELRRLEPPLAAALMRDRETAGQLLGATLPPSWPQPDFLDILPLLAAAEGEAAKFGAWAMVERVSNTVVEEIGFLGPPVDGVVEMGFGFRRTGTADGQISWSFPADR